MEISKAIEQQLKAHADVLATPTKSSLIYKNACLIEELEEKEKKLNKISSLCTLAPAIDSEELATKILNVIEGENITELEVLIEACKECIINYEKIKKYKKIMDSIFKDDLDFCNECSAKGKCNGCCCYEHIKEILDYDN